MSEQSLRDCLLSHPFKGPFSPHWFYNADGQQIEACWSNDNYYGEAVGDPESAITLYRSESDPAKIVGCILYRVPAKVAEAATNRQHDEIERLRGCVARLEQELSDLRDKHALHCQELELRAATHGAIQARREVMEYLRSIGQPLTAMAIDQRCTWPDKSAKGIDA